jgi:hypothetical protein
MQSNPLLTIDLRASICAIVSGSQTRQQLNEFVLVCHAIASISLRRKVAAAMLQSRFHYSTYSDLAFDCIADLFTQDDHGVLTQVKGYFEGLDLVASDNEELLSHLRRLIASKVNHGMFRVYGEVDPGLGKVLRNIKLAIQARDNFTVMTRFGDWYLCPTMTEPNLHLPVFEPQELERELCRTANGSETVPELLSKLSLLLRRESANANSVPLLTVARVFRSIYIRGGEVVDSVGPEDSFIVPDAIAIIDEMCGNIKSEMKPKYVDRKKVEHDTFETYFAVIRLSLIDHFVGGDGKPATFFENFKTLQPDLTREAYYDYHRPVVEYLGRITRERVAERLKAVM